MLSVTFLTIELYQTNMHSHLNLPYLPFRHWLAATDMEAQDYDGRTALHVATSEGHEEIVEYLLTVCEVQPLPKVRKCCTYKGGRL